MYANTLVVERCVIERKRENCKINKSKAYATAVAQAEANRVGERDEK